MTTIYHNPRCSKSRQCLALLEEKKENLNIIKYLDTTFTVAQLTGVINQLGIKPIDLVRKNETVWKQSFKGRDFTDKDLIKIMCEHPKLIERPIIIKNDKAVIGRPPEKVIEIL